MPSDEVVRDKREDWRFPPAVPTHFFSPPSRSNFSLPQKRTDEALGNRPFQIAVTNVHTHGGIRGSTDLVPIP